MSVHLVSVLSGDIWTHKCSLCPSEQFQTSVSCCIILLSWYAPLHFVINYSHINTTFLKIITVLHCVFTPLFKWKTETCRVKHRKSHPGKHYDWPQQLQQHPKVLTGVHSLHPAWELQGIFLFAVLWSANSRSAIIWNNIFVSWLL